MPISIFVDTFCKHFSWGNRIKVAKCFPFLYSIIYGYYKDNRLIVQKNGLIHLKEENAKSNNAVKPLAKSCSAFWAEA